MIASAPIRRKPTYSEIAVSALDQLAYQVHKNAQGRLPQTFWDWIADDITPFVHSSMRHTLRDHNAKAQLSNRPTAEVVQGWVRQWVSPYLAERFGVVIPASKADNASQDTEFIAMAYPDVLLF